MIQFRPARPEDLPGQKELWQLSFGDSEAYIDDFFRYCGPYTKSMVLEEGGALRGGLQLMPVTLRGEHGEEWRCAYIYAVCVHPDSRGQGFGKALVSYADFFLQEKGFDCAVTVPADQGLHRFYALQGYGECFRRREDQAEPGPVRSGDTGRRIEGAEYGRLREARLEGTLRVSYPTPLLDYQQFLCGERGGLFALEADGVTGCACAERQSDGSVLVKELLMPPGLEERGLAVLGGLLGADRLTVRAPDPAGERCGMLRWYRNDIAFDWNWAGQTGYLGLAFD